MAIYIYVLLSIGIILYSQTPYTIIMICIFLFHCYTETIDKAEECFAHVINKIDNNEVAKGLRYCGLLCNTAWESFRQVLTTYRMSCLIVKIVLSMENADFEKLCVYIESQGQAKQLSDLYYGKLRSYVCIICVNKKCLAQRQLDTYKKGTCILSACHTYCMW